MRNYNDAKPQEMMLFDTRIVFLITALNRSTQRTVKVELKGHECLIDMLKNISLRCDQHDSNIIEVYSVFVKVQERVSLGGGE